MADPIKRVNYFKHQFLRAKDFNEEQGYHVEMRRRHNRLLHTWGIAGDGLKLSFTQGATAVKVSPGMAVDREGREIVLVEEQTVELAGADPGVPVYIIIKYAEAKTDLSTETGAEGETRWTEAPLLKYEAAKPSDVGLNIILGRVKREGGTKVTGLDETDRRTAGVSTGDLAVRTLTLSRPDVDASTWPRLSCSTANQATLENGALRLEANREIFFADGGQLRSLDNAHRIAFNRAANLLQFFEYGDITFATGGASPSERLRIAASGNVGIGRTASTDRLEVQGNIRATALQFMDGAGTSYPDNGLGMANNIEGATKWLQVSGITDGGARRMALVADRVYASGRLGIGVSAPAAQLHISGGLGDVWATDGDFRIGNAAGSLKVGVATAGVVAGDVRLRAVGGTSRLYLGSGQTDTLTIVGGNVGIATPSPSTQLHIRKDATGALGPILTLMNGGGSGNAGVAIDFHSYEPAGANAPAARLQTYDNNYSNHISFQTKLPGAAANALVERMRILSSGQVGIGTATPDRALTVAGEDRAYINVKTTDGSAEVLLGVDGAGGIVSTMSPHDLQLRAGSNDTKMIVKNNGNVGISTTTPQARLEIVAPAGDWMFLRQQRKTEGGGGFHIHNPWRDTDGPDRNRLEIGYKAPGGADSWGLFVITPSGNVGIATSTPDTKLEVVGTTKTQKLQLGNKWLLSGDADAYTNDDWLRLMGVSDPRTYYGGFAAGKLWSTGGVVQGSDVRLKKEVAPLGDVTQNLLALRGVRFKWQDAGRGDSPQFGLIAQEVERIFPELVTDGPDGIKGINYAGLIPPLVETVKQQQAQITELRAELQSLKRQLPARKRASRGVNQ
jgi:Chaperone of endosialidase